MRVQYISDIHCEFHCDLGIRFAEELPIQGDVLLICGDFATTDSLVRTLTILCNRWAPLPVLFIPGNHEYYLSDRGAVSNNLAKLAHRHKNFIPGNNRVTVINEVRFVGSTLWWDESRLNPLEIMTVRGRLNDYSKIVGYRKWIGDAHKKSVEFLTANVQRGDVVFTHHAPSWQSQDRTKHPEYRPLDHSYYNNLDGLIEERGPAVWIHGHTHDAADYRIGETRVLSAPHGYTQPNCYADPNRFGVVDV